MAAAAAAAGPASRPAHLPFDGTIDKRYHLGNLLHHVNTQRLVISVMHDAIAEAQKTIPERPASLLYDVDDVVFMAQLFLYATETSEAEVRAKYPEFVRQLEEETPPPFPGMAVDESAEATDMLVSRALKSTIKSSGSAIGGLDADAIATALDDGLAKSSDEDEEDGGLGTGGETSSAPGTPIVTGSDSGITEGLSDTDPEKRPKKRSKRQPKRKKGAPPSIHSSMTLAELLAHPVHMKESKEVQIATGLDYNAPSMHYRSILAKCQWANTTNQHKLVLTWYVIVFLYLSEGLRDRVCAATDPGLAKPYFDGVEGKIDNFDTRMADYLFGRMVHDRKRKLRTLERVACPSLLIVIKECLVFRMITQTYHAH